MNYEDIKYDLIAYLDLHYNHAEYCEEEDCSGGLIEKNYQDEDLDGTLQLHHFDVLLEYVDHLPLSQKEKFLELYYTKNHYFSKSQVRTFGLLCKLEINKIDELLNKVGYLFDTESVEDLVYQYFFESSYYNINLLHIALKDIKDNYGNKNRK